MRGEKLLLHEGTVAEKDRESFPLKRRSVCFRIHREYHKFQYHIIHTLWELYLKYEQFGCSTWEQIDEMLEYWMESQVVTGGE